MAYTSVPLDPAPEISRPSKSSSWIFRVVACVLIVMIVGLIIYGIQRYHKKNSVNGIESENDTSEICSTKYCHQAAQFVRKCIDESVDPCENFYEFTCGSFIKNTQLSDVQGYESTIANVDTQVANIMADLLSASSEQNIMQSKAIFNARRLFQSCMDENNLMRNSTTMLHRLINTELGGIPNDVGSSWNKSNFNLLATLVKLNRYNTFPFFHVSTALDENSTNPLKTVIYISAGLKYNADEDILDGSVFRTSSKRDLSLFLSKYNLTEDDFPLTFEQQINQYLLTSLTDDSASDITTTVGQLSSTIQTNFNFNNYIRRLYRLVNVTLMDNDSVIIHQISKIRSISSLLSKQTKETLQTYMMQYFLQSQVYQIIKNFHKTLRTLLTSQFPDSDDRLKRMSCAEYVKKNMPYAVSKLYIDKYYDPHAQHESTELVTNIRNTFIDTVKASTWMDAVSKKKTIEKAQAMREKVGYPQYLAGNNMTKLETMYAQYQLTSSLTENIRILLKIKSKENLEYLREPIIREEWLHYGPMSINAFYHPLLNDITIPIGILQPPIFHKDAPKYVNYGMIGALVGHEIAHGFDEIRRHTDADGNHHSLWSQETNDIFDRRSTCITEQYDNYTVLDIDLPVNGTQTREENIADNDGLQKTFFAYQKWAKSNQISEKKLPGFTHYSAEQMLFISFGQLWCSKLSDQYARVQHSDDTHAPSQFRAIGSTSNFDEFDRVFRCKPGQGNSRVNKCRVW